jgi:hypothetical protein
VNWVLDDSQIAWQKSSFSTNDGSCVEIAVVSLAAKSERRQRSVVVRDSKDPSGPKLIFTPEVWKHFLGRIKGGSFDLSS